MLRKGLKTLPTGCFLGLELTLQKQPAKIPITSAV